MVVLHGGIGDGSWSLEDLAAVERPLRECWDAGVPACAIQVFLSLSMLVETRAIPCRLYAIDVSRPCGATPPTPTLIWRVACTRTLVAKTSPYLVGPIARSNRFKSPGWFTLLLDIINLSNTQPAGLDVTAAFCQHNNVQLVVRSHQCVRGVTYSAAI